MAAYPLRSLLAVAGRLWLPLRRVEEAAEEGRLPVSLEIASRSALRYLSAISRS
eukprot:SAG31_NODE_22415_length_526_cov_0.843091_1_plen_53_part_10